MIKESTKEKTSLPVGWEMKPLGEVCEINPKKSELNNLPTNHLVSFLPMRDLGVAQNQINSITIKQLSEVKGSYTYFRNNDILLAKVTPCFEKGKLGIAKNLKNEIGFGSSEYIVFRPRNEILSEYIFYILSRSKFRNRGKELMYGAVGLKRLSKDYVKNFIAPFPSIKKQKQIVAILDKAFAAIDTAKANAAQNLQNAKELFESYLQNVFENKGDDWEEKTLGDIAEVKSGGTPSRARKEFWGGSIAWYSSGELNNTYTTKPERHINQLAIENSTAKRFKKGSLLIGMYDTAALKMSILDREGAFNQAISGVLPNENIDLQFILHSINSIKPEILSLRRGVRQKNLNLTKIKNIPIYLPSIKEQKKIVQKLDSLSAETKKLETLYTHKIADLEELKKSVLQKAFSGQLI
jgi:type I restriction enzyme S subunit